ncbi:MAG: hypothetical protein WCO55_01240 [Candidatus Falkowbacteria bacterium]
MEKHGVKILLAIFIVLLAVAFGVYSWSNKTGFGLVRKAKPVAPAVVEAPVEPLSYATGNVPVVVTSATSAFPFTVKQLKAMALGCKSKHAADYFTTLTGKFAGAIANVYSFKYNGTSQDKSIFTVTLIPNKTGYTTLEEFKKDFDSCQAGAKLYPTAVNANWLMFTNSCTTGYDNGSGKVHGCQLVQDAVKPTLKLN